LIGAVVEAASAACPDAAPATLTAIAAANAAAPRSAALDKLRTRTLGMFVPFVLFFVA
jgi:hypothetical protein